MKTIAVLGTGNVAQTIAVDMKAKGQEVRLFAISSILRTSLRLLTTTEKSCFTVFFHLHLQQALKFSIVFSSLDAIMCRRLTRTGGQST